MCIRDSEDIVRQLHLNHPRTFISSFDRPNISLTVKRGFQAKEKNKAILEFIDVYKRQGYKGDIHYYVESAAVIERLLNATPYSILFILSTVI